MGLDIFFQELKENLPDKTIDISESLQDKTIDISESL